jgi:hypothetical protein
MGKWDKTTCLFVRRKRLPRFTRRDSCPLARAVGLAKSRRTEMGEIQSLEGDLALDDVAGPVLHDGTM